MTRIAEGETVIEGRVSRGEAADRYATSAAPTAGHERILPAGERPGALRRRSLLSSCEAWPAELGLSPRECEIARLVARDLSNKEIAAVLEISSWTVATHLRRTFAKLGVHSKAAMVGRILDRIASARPASLDT